MRSATLLALAVSLSLGGAVTAQQIDYTALWDKALPFDQFLKSVRALETQWRSRFASAAVDADTLNEARALTDRRRILAVVEDRCPDSAWAIPYIAKLAATVPERIELRVIRSKDGGRLQSANLSPDGRIATPTVVVLDEMNRPVGAWVERPSELQQWFIDNKGSMSEDELHDKMAAWYENDAGKSTLREILALLKKQAKSEGGV